MHQAHLEQTLLKQDSLTLIHKSPLVFSANVKISYIMFCVVCQYLLETTTK